MLKKLFIGSNNEHKILEIKEIFKLNNFEVEILSPNDFNVKGEPIEDGLSFNENALIKAKYYYDLFKLPTVGEDSGIEIEYFGNRPNIYSKRFLGHLNDYDKNEYILDLMKYVKNRKARFVTSLAFIDENGNHHLFVGENVGNIALKQAGNKGFGYDPIFEIQEYKKTEAELGEEYKNEYSHRAKAFKEFINYVKEK